MIFFFLFYIFFAINSIHSLCLSYCLLADVISEGGDGISSCRVIGDFWPVVHRESRFFACRAPCKVYGRDP